MAEDASPLRGTVSSYLYPTTLSLADRLTVRRFFHYEVCTYMESRLITLCRKIAVQRVPLRS